jgi:hypothetical protein
MLQSLPRAVLDEPVCNCGQCSSGTYVHPCGISARMCADLWTHPHTRRSFICPAWLDKGCAPCYDSKEFVSLTQAMSLIMLNIITTCTLFEQHCRATQRKFLPCTLLEPELSRALDSAPWLESLTTNGAALSTAAFKGLFVYHYLWLTVAS